MSIPASLLGALTLFPAMTGPIGEEDAAQAVVHFVLCNGGTVTMPISGGPAPATSPCCAKGCRSSGKRKQFDQEQ